MIYLDNAATSWPKPEPVITAVTTALRTGGTPGRGAYPAALAAGRTLFGVRSRAAELVHAAGPGQVVCTASATAGLNIAITGLLRPGDHAVTTDLEHNSVLRPLYAARARGVEVTVVRSERGVVDPDAIAAALRPNTALVALTHASNVLGTVQPIAEIATICARRGVFFVVDAAQTVGLLPLDLTANQGIAALALGGHKGLLGPQGTGLLVLRPDVRPAPLEYGGTGSDSLSETMPTEPPGAYEAGTPNIPGMAGLAAALEVVLGTGVADRPGDFLAAELAHARRLKAGLAELGCVVFPEIDERAWGVPVVSATVLGRDKTPLDSAEVADALSEAGIAVRGGFHCAPGVHTRYGTLATGLVRFSPGHASTTDEIDAAVAAIAAIAKES